MKRILKAIIGAFLLLIGSDCTARRKAVDEGICDLSGQGKDRYGE